jgi:hypothetical protein
MAWSNHDIGSFCVKLGTSEASFMAISGCYQMQWLSRSLDRQYEPYRYNHAATIFFPIDQSMLRFIQLDPESIAT